MLGRKRYRCHRKGSAIYLMVLATAVLVSLLGVSSLENLRIARAKSELSQDRMKANALAYSAVGIGLRTLEQDPDWRTNYTNGQATELITIKGNSNSLIQWAVEDTDGDLTNTDKLLSITGVGRVNNAMQVASAQYNASLQEIGPSLLWNENGGTNRRNGFLQATQWWGQCFQPTLPAEALAWKIDSIQLFMRQETPGMQFTANIAATSDDLSPSNSLIDTTTKSTDELNSLWGWQSIEFNGSNWLGIDQGICFTIESATDNPLELRYRWMNASNANAALITNDGSGWQVDNDGALLMNVYIVYTNGQQTVEIIDGTWRRGDLP